MAQLDQAVASVRAAVRHALADVEPGARVLVACSGGADSMALTASTAFESERRGWQVGAVVVDHRMQEGSSRIAQDTAERAADLGCDPVEVAQVTVGAPGGPEAAARRARYAALEEVGSRWNAWVLLAHTRDDQAETVLLGLARGSGTRSLSGMPSQSGRYRRPLLDVPRAQTRRACQALGLTVWDDPMNTDEAYTRVRVRRSVLPVLEEHLGPGVVEALARTARHARADADALDAAADDLETRARAEGPGIGVGLLAQATPALRRRVLRSAALSAGCPAGELFAVHVEQLERLVTDWRGQAGVDLPGSVVARREDDRITFDYPH